LLNRRALLLVAGITAAGPPAAAQVQFRGNPRHTGVFDSTAIGDFGGLLWRVQTDGPVRSSPTVVDGVVYVGSGDGTLYAVDARSGQIRWRAPAGAAITSSPAVTGGLVILATRMGWQALDQHTAAVRWHLDVGPDLPLPWGHESGDRYLSSPAVVGDTVLLGGGDGVLRSVALATGRIQWEAHTSGRIRSSPAIADGLVVVGDADGVVYGFALTNGALRWRHETEGHMLLSARFGYDRRTIQSSPAIMDGRVFVGARDGYLYAIDLLTGERRWRFNHEISWVNTSPAVDGGLVYAGSSDGQFAQAVDARSGQERWRAKTGLIWASPAVSGGTVFFGDNTGRLTAFDKNTGSVRWSYRAGGPIFSSPVVAQGVVYVGSDDGSIYAIDASAKVRLRRAVYWDSTLGVTYSVPGHRTIRDWFRDRDYELLDAAALSRFMSRQIQDGAASVVVLAGDQLPSSVVPSPADTVLLRRYLNFGGRIVCPGLPPLLWPRDPVTGDLDLDKIDRTSAARLVGVSFEKGNFDPNGTSIIAEPGARLGMRAGWLSTWAADAEGVTEVLATDETGLASAWIKRYGQGGAFIRIPAVPAGTTGVANLRVLQTAAEMRDP
jgi:outer membrane protein assembly factor BamB